MVKKYRGTGVGLKESSMESFA